MQRRALKLPYLFSPSLREQAAEELRATYRMYLRRFYSEIPGVSWTPKKFLLSQILSWIVSSGSREKRQVSRSYSSIGLKTIQCCYKTDILHFLTTEHLPSNRGCTGHILNPKLKENGPFAKKGPTGVCVGGEGGNADSHL